MTTISSGEKGGSQATKNEDILSNYIVYYFRGIYFVNHVTFLESFDDELRTASLSAKY